MPRRGSSRGTSIASSNKAKKEDRLLDDLDGLFAKEYKKPQQSIIDSLNNSKKNTPDNSSSKTKAEIQNINEQILNKKLEDLNEQFKTDENRKSSGAARSSSVPLKEPSSVKSETT